jgi:D-serine deaminase-like pyridoxal phosphate-dependent protein
LDTIGAYLLPVALVLGAPASQGTHEQGLFCETVELVERVAEFADRGANPLRVVADVNARLGRTACLYAIKPDVRARTVQFEKSVAVRHGTYAIYQVQVTSFGAQKTEIGEIEWMLPRPRTMYTVRAASPAQTVSH